MPREFTAELRSQYVPVLGVRCGKGSSSSRSAVWLQLRHWGAEPPRWGWPPSELPNAVPIGDPSSCRTSGWTSGLRHSSTCRCQKVTSGHSSGPNHQVHLSTGAVDPFVPPVVTMPRLPRDCRTAESSGQGWCHGGGQTPMGWHIWQSHGVFVGVCTFSPLWRVV